MFVILISTVGIIVSLLMVLLLYNTCNKFIYSMTHKSLIKESSIHLVVVSIFLMYFFVLCNDTVHSLLMCFT